MLSCVGLMYAVVLAVPFHWTTEHGTKFVPTTFRVNAPEPASALEGDSGDVVAVIGEASVAAVTEKLTEFDRADPLDTVMGTVTALIASANGMSAVTCVALTNEVGRGWPFQFTTEPPFTKFVPFTISVKPSALHLGTVETFVVDPAN
jgi:hypothetical protein